jgi:hypothetical protein
MDIDTDSRHVTRLEIVETGRRRRWSVEEKLRTYGHHEHYQQDGGRGRNIGMLQPCIDFRMERSEQDRKRQCPGILCPRRQPAEIVRPKISP